MATVALREANTQLATPPRQRMTPWQVWGLILNAPYVLIFLAFVVYPVGYGLWLARHPVSYEKLFADPIFSRSVVNTIVFLCSGLSSYTTGTIVSVDGGAAWRK